MNTILQAILVIAVFVDRATASFYLSQGRLSNDEQVVYYRSTVDHEADLRCLETDGSTEIIVHSYAEYVDVCYIATRNANPLDQQMQSRAHSKIQGDSCYRFFDKIDFIEGSGAHLWSQLNKIVSEQKQFLKSAFIVGESEKKENAVLSSKLQIQEQDAKSIQDLKWTGLKHFAVHYCNGTREDSSVSLKLISLTFDKQPNSTAKSDVAFARKKLHGKGFHQSVTVTLSLPSAWDITMESSCDVVFEQVLPHTSYVDYNQLNRPESNRKVTLVPQYWWGDKIFYIDIEKPAYLAHQYWYKYSTSISLWSEKASLTPKYSEFTYELPIHFRYPTPSNSTEQQIIPMHPFSSIYLQCGDRHYKIKQDIQVDKGSAKIPVGNSNHKKMVGVITLISEILCAVLLVKQLKKA